MRVSGFATMVLVLALGVQGAAPAAAETCASETVTARGEASRYEWSGKLKARANWRVRVRQMSSLGAPYSNWNRAKDASISCKTDRLGFTCVASGRPCRP